MLGEIFQMNGFQAVSAKNGAIFLSRGHIATLKFEKRKFKDDALYTIHIKKCHISVRA